MDHGLRTSLFRTYKLIIFGLGCLLMLSLAANVVTAYLAWSMHKQERVVVTPMVYHQPFSVSGTIASPAYLRQTALSFLYLLLNVTPESVSKNQQLVLSYTTPELYPALEKVLSREKHTIKTNAVSSVFYPDHVSVDSQNNQVDVTGVLHVHAGVIPLNPESKHYRLSLTLTNGRVQISRYQEVKSHGL